MQREHVEVPYVPLTEYRAEFQMMNAYDEPDLWYWHLYCKDVRVNGGIANSREDARERAKMAKYSHHRSMWAENWLWDVESHRWQLRE
jgi:hypothetical protein